MAIYLDDQSVELTGESVGAVVMTANQRVAADGRMIVEVELDGQGLSGETLAQRQHETLAGRELRLRSASPVELATAALDQVRTRLHDTREVQAQCAQLIQRDQTAEALGRFNDVIATWLAVQEAVANVSRLMRVNLGELTVDAVPAQQTMGGLVEALQSFKRMIQDGDTVALADALAYEWPQMTDQWDRLLAGLIDKIESDTKG